MGKQIFRKGDPVYHHKHGWRTIESFMHVGQKNTNVYKFTDGTTDVEDMLSFTEYRIEVSNFTQERPIDYNDYIGKWGGFYDNDLNNAYLCKLDEYLPGYSHQFVTVSGCRYINFKPLSDEAVEILKKEGIIKE